jgi:hypothetical protein
MRHRWTQLHPRQWPTIIRIVTDDEKREFVGSDYSELWIHQIGYYLIKLKQTAIFNGKHWKLISPATGELIYQ